MAAARSRIFRLGLLLASGLALLTQPTASRAYTQEEQAACSGDAFRLCGPEIPDVDRVTACMVRNMAQFCSQSLKQSLAQRMLGTVEREATLAPARDNSPIHSEARGKPAPVAVAQPV